MMKINITDQELNAMLDVIEKHNQLCIICQYFIECNGLTQGPEGPLHPPCADRGTAFDSGFFDEDDIIEIYEDIIGEGYEGNQGCRGMPGLCPNCKGTNLNWNSKTDVSVCCDCGWSNEEGMN